MESQVWKASDYGQLVASVTDSLCVPSTQMAPQLPVQTSRNCSPSAEVGGGGGGGGGGDLSSESDGDRGGEGDEGGKGRAATSVSSAGVGTQSDDDEFVLITNTPGTADDNTVPSKGFLSSYLGAFYPASTPSRGNSGRTLSASALSSASLSSYMYTSSRKHRCFNGHSKVMLVAGEGEERGEGGEGSGGGQGPQHVPRWRVPIPRLRIVIMAVGTR